MSNIKEALAEKIDSKEKWEEFKKRFSYYASRSRAVRGFDGAQVIVDQAVWWAHRELMRLSEGVYEVTDVLERINHANQHFVHISKEDRTMIAYTPDAQAGERDKQVRTSLGKYLTKYFPVLTDHYIQDIVADHASDLSTDVEYIQGSENIVNAYLNGVHSCMAKEFPAYGHPATVYGTKNIAMAVLRDKEGKINARALVRLKQKIYIRAYGDPKLVKRLTKLGYTAGSWVGETFKAIPVKHDSVSNAWLMPYLDANGRAGSTDCGYVAVIDGTMRVIEPEKHATIHKVLGNGYTSSGVTTAGYVSLKPIESSGFSIKDAVTNEPINMLEVSSSDLTKVFVGGKEGYTRVDTVDLTDLLSFVVAYDKRTSECMYAERRSTFKPSGSGTRYIDDKYAREWYGYKQLDPNVYKDVKWAKKSEVVAVGNSNMLLADVVTILEPAITLQEGQTTDAISIRYEHNTFDVKGLTKVHANTRGVKVYASKGVRTYKTPTGKTVALRYNDVSKDYKGNIDFDRNLKSVRVLGDEYLVSKTEPRENYAIMSDFWKVEIEKKVHNWMQETPYMGLSRLCYEQCGIQYVNYKGRNFWAYDYPWRADSRYVRDFKLQELVDLFVGRLREVASTSTSAVEKYVATRTIAVYTAIMAEANAVEAPARLDYQAPTEVAIAAVEPELEPA